MRLITTFLTLLLFNQVIAQDSTSIHQKTLYRITLGSGFAPGQILSNRTVICYTADFTVQRKTVSWSAALHGLSDFMVFGGPANSIQAIDAMVGKILSRGNIFIDLSGGIGCVFSSLYYDPKTGNDYNTSDFHQRSLGIPLSAKFIWQPVRQMGLGIELYANLNKNSFYAINFCMQAGRLKPKK